MKDTGTWTQERILLMFELWDEGLSAAEIGKRLGMSKNMVIGKLHRLGLSARGEYSGDLPVQPGIVFPDSGRCLWPIGDPPDPDFRFCGEEAQPQGPYCPEHHAQAYIGRRSRSAGETAPAGGEEPRISDL